MVTALLQLPTIAKREETPTHACHSTIATMHGRRVWFVVTAIFHLLAATKFAARGQDEETVNAGKLTSRMIPVLLHCFILWLRKEFMYTCLICQLVYIANHCVYSSSFSARGAFSHSRPPPLPGRYPADFGAAGCPGGRLQPQRSPLHAARRGAQQEVRVERRKSSLRDRRQSR